LASNYSKPSSNAYARPSKATHLENLHWTNLILYGIKGDMGTWVVEIIKKVTEQLSHTTMIFSYEKGL
jgi:hypothetical protein